MNSKELKRKKLIRLTAHSCTLGLLKGQLGYLQKEMDVILVAKDLGELPALAAQEGTEYRDVNMQREISPVKDLKSLWTLIRLFRKEKPDIVHANTPKGALLGLLAAWITRVPHRIYNVNGLRFETATGNFRRLLIMMERIACACANKVIPQSNGVADVLRREHVTNKPLKVILNGSGNGVDILRFNPEDSDIIAKGAEIRGDFKGVAFVFVGRLVGDKGVNELVDAFERLHQKYSDTALHLVGHLETHLDPLKPETLRKIDVNEAIIAEGQQNDVRPYLKASDVMVLPSYREGFPNVILEAASMGLPCIATDVNGAVDAIKNGVNGFDVPKRDVEALYQAMKRIYEDTNLRQQMAKNARPFVASHFNRPDVWQATLEMYRNL
jgi:glycosyltransferase involved in cell wall biosynthesis